MTKIARFILVLSGLVLSSQCLADAGPYYLSTTGFCNIRKFYLTAEGFIYGKEVGCPVTTSTGNYTFVGFYGGGTKFTVSRVSANNTTGDPKGLLNVNAYDLYTGIVDSYTSDGITMTSTALGNPYTFSVTKPSGAFANLPSDDEVRK